MSIVKTGSSFNSIDSDGGTDPTSLNLPSSFTVNSEAGLLEAMILSVYDLPSPEQPKAITLTCCGITVSTGPPVARHKDRNSFRFSKVPTSSSSLTSSASTSKNELKLAAPLRELYKSKMIIRLVYDDQSLNLVTEQDIKELRIRESSWLILNFTSQEPSTTAVTFSNNEDGIQPTLRLKVELNGPYRPEIAALVGLGKAWCSLVDQIEGSTQTLIQGLPKVPLPDFKFFIIPTVPLITIAVVASPVVAGVLMVGLPFILPIILILIMAVVSSLVFGGVLFSSSRYGREHIGGTIAPFVDSLISTPPFQKLIYDTGPRPTPVSVARQVVPKEIWGKLVISLLIDMIGSSSYLLPVVGEGFDLAWAPLQTILVMAMYDEISPNLKYVSFAEEILPFTDIVPSATIGWGVEFVPQLLSSKIENSPELITVLTKASAAIGRNPST